MESNTPKTHQLRKVLGVAFGLAVVIGSTIGVGILRTPGSIAALVPDAKIIMACWVLIGLYIILAASSYAELTTMFPKAGGAYNYIKRAFGNYCGFLNGWFDFLTNAIAPAYFCIVLSEYSILMFPQLANFKTIVAVSFLTFFTVVNLPGIKSGSFVQQLTSVAKVILFLVLIVGCFTFTPEVRIPAETTVIKGGLLLGLFKSLQLIMGTYDGWMSVSFFAEEDQNPSKNIPRSYLLGASAIAVLYMLINAAILYVLPIESIAGSPLAASDAAAAAFGGWSGTLMTAVAIFSVIGILNAYMLIPSRILFGLGRDGFFIPQSTIVNKGGTPYYSLLICYVLALVLTVYGSFEQLFGLATIMMTLVTAFAFASLIRLRNTEPDFPRPYKAFAYPFSTWLALVVTIALFIGFAMSDTLSLCLMVGVTVVSYPCYRFFVKTNNPIG